LEGEKTVPERERGNVQRPTLNVELQKAELPTLSFRGSIRRLPLLVETLDVERWTLDVFFLPAHRYCTEYASINPTPLAPPLPLTITV
jgi:hypothetical protein